MNKNKYIRNIKRIAIVAYSDSRKGLIEWSYANKNILTNHIIISTARTAGILEGTLNVPVFNVDHGRSGGYHQIKHLIEDNKVDIVILFGSSLEEEHHHWFDLLIQAAIKHDIVVAYNKATIDMIVNSIASEKTNDHETENLLRLMRKDLTGEVKLAE